MISVDDASTGHDLVSSASPLVVNLGSQPVSRCLTVKLMHGASKRFAVRASAHWIEVAPTVDVAANHPKPFQIVITPEADDEFAVVSFEWKEAGEPFAETILIQRRRLGDGSGKAAQQSGSSPVPAQSSSPGTGTSELPEWMR